MLIKLIKYEMKAMGRILGPIYILLIAASLMMSVSFNSSLADNPLVALVFDRFDFIFVILFVVVALATGVMMAVMVIQRFYKNLLGQEGYLMFTLPVTTGQHLVSKLITAVIWIVLGIISGGLGGLVIIFNMADMSSFWSDIGEALRVMGSYYGNENVTKGIILLVIMLLVSALRSLMQIYAALSLGQLWNSHRLAGSALVYVGFSIISSVISRLIGSVTTNSEFRSGGLVFSYVSGTSGMGNALIWSILISAAAFVILYAITWLVLDRRLNLE